MGKSLRNIIDPAGLSNFRSNPGNALTAGLDPIGGILRNQTGTKFNMQGIFDPASLYKNNAAGGGGPSDGSPSGVPTGSPSYPGFQPSPFAQIPGLGRYSQQALGLLGQIPQGGPIPGQQISPSQGIGGPAGVGIPGLNNQRIPQPPNMRIPTNPMRPMGWGGYMGRGIFGRM